MNVSHLVNFAAALVICGIQWTAVLSSAPHTPSVREAGIQTADDAPEGSLPVVVVTAHRRS